LLTLSPPRRNNCLESDVRTGDRGIGKGFSQQYHYWPRNLNRKKGRGKRGKERTPVQLENRIAGCKLTSSYLNTKLWVEKRN
jgi:hypothetical protein